MANLYTAIYEALKREIKLHNKKLPIRKWIRLIIFVPLSIIVIIVVLNLLLNNRIVGYVKGSNLYYKSEVYMKLNITFRPQALVCHLEKLMSVE